MLGRRGHVRHMARGKLGLTSLRASALAFASVACVLTLSTSAAASNAYGPKVDDRVAAAETFGHVFGAETVKDDEVKALGAKHLGIDPWSFLPADKPELLARGFERVLRWIRARARAYNRRSSRTPKNK